MIAEGCMFVQLTGSLPESDCNHYLDHHRDYICCYRYNVHVFLRHHLSCMLCACVARSHTHALQHRCVENFIRACVCMRSMHEPLSHMGHGQGWAPKLMSVSITTKDHSSMGSFGHDMYRQICSATV